MAKSHQILKDDAAKPLYHQIFLNKAKMVLLMRLLPEKVDGSQLLSNFKPTWRFACKSKNRIWMLLPLLPDDKLTFSNLSCLFAASRLMKKLKLKADDFVISPN